ncbi:hypothetical protein SSPS47_25805 [Streptomyces sp. S4.7]|uniref:hypothetical protein n=1 Tax=Streptomyces sp. S4.7 TaxID=2705439 RepID=UPI00139965C2|nr:hypothetical protein [Streptomyces sp. S4.7]QHY98530.1 hypothetical protein SSPS47_25805 [Streptomyces sp. S4.7]
MSKKVLIPLTSLVVVGLAAAAFYALGLPPFEKRGKIKASKVCESLGDSTKAASTLETVLPKEPEYSFRGRVTGEQVTQQSDAFRSDCTVYGEGKTLLSAGTLVMETQSADSWAKYSLEDGDEARESFAAGSGGFITADNTVAIQVPCAKAGTIPGGEYSLRVVVDLRSSEASDRVRQGLKDLAVETARFAHEKTECNLPAELPE